MASKLCILMHSHAFSCILILQCQLNSVHGADLKTLWCITAHPFHTICIRSPALTALQMCRWPFWSMTRNSSHSRGSSSSAQYSHCRYAPPMVHQRCLTFSCRTPRIETCCCLLRHPAPAELSVPQIPRRVCTDDGSFVCCTLVCISVSTVSSCRA